MLDFVRVGAAGALLAVAVVIAVRGVSAHRAGRPTAMTIAALRVPARLLVAGWLTWVSVVTLAAAAPSAWAAGGYVVLGLATVVFAAVQGVIVRSRTRRGWTRGEALEIQRHVCSR